jgi:hypothetical protein
VAAPGPRSALRVEAPDVASAKAAAAIQFDLDEIQRNRITHGAANGAPARERRLASRAERGPPEFIIFTPESRVRLLPRWFVVGGRRVTPLKEALTALKLR